MKSTRWNICAAVLATTIGAASIFYPDWISFVSDSGWWSLAFWIPLSIIAFWGVIVMWSLTIEAIKKWIVPPLIRLLER